MKIEFFECLQKARSLVRLHFLPGPTFHGVSRESHPKVFHRIITLKTRLRKMDCQSNSFENLIHSFKTVCSTLEANAEADLMDIEKQCKEEFLASAKTLEKFNELTLGISETCKEILKPGEILNTLMKRTNPEAAINIPYDIHSDLVNSINALYNMPPLGKGAGDEKLINDRNKQLMSDLIKECERNIYDMREIQSAVVDAKATLQ